VKRGSGETRRSVQSEDLRRNKDLEGQEAKSESSEENGLGKRENQKVRERASRSEPKNKKERRWGK